MIPVAISNAKATQARIARPPTSCKARCTRLSSRKRDAAILLGTAHQKNNAPGQGRRCEARRQATAGRATGRPARVEVGERVIWSVFFGDNNELLMIRQSLGLEHLMALSL